ncbi:MAG: hypothetical protein QOH97_3963 [Actinoplanes sp.]|jgi:hypothetical protein|nr:hypothetical protein [Actinoplanes sp.]
MTRFVHLTYASLASEADMVGGWQFKQDSGSTPAEREWTLPDVPTTQDLPEPLSRYPGPDELAAIPRRMAFIAGDDMLPAFLVHSVAAGPDATRRPGNVFSQVLLDRDLTDELAGEKPVRPIEYWRSPMWLTPYGHDAVRSAHVDEDLPPQLGGGVVRDRIIASFKEDPASANRITELLDATDAALAGRTKVVLIVGDPDDAARWIGILSFLASPPTAARLTFSTYERTAELLTNGARAMLSAVLTADFFDPVANHPAIAAGQDRLVFFDLSSDPQVVRYGPEQSQSDWSELIVELFDETAATIVERLQMMDAISRDYPEAAASPCWPLAVAMARTESADEALQVVGAAILRHTPATIDLDPDLALTARTLLARFAGSDRGALLTVLGGKDRRVSANRLLLDMALEAVAGRPPDEPGDPTASPVLEAVIAEIRRRGDEQSSWSQSALVLLDQLMKSSGLISSGRWHERVADALAREVRRDPRLPKDFDGDLDEKTRQRLAAVTNGGV